MNRKKTIILFFIATTLISTVLFSFLSKYLALIILTCLILLSGFYYLIKLNKIYIAFKWKSVENWFLKTIIGAILISWTGTFLYGFIFPSPDKTIIENQESIKSQIENNSKMLSKNQDSIYGVAKQNNSSLENMPERITEMVMERIELMAKDQNRKVEDLIIENKSLKEKIKRLSVANINVKLQEHFYLLISEFRYQEARLLIENFINLNTNINSENLAKLHYLMTLTYIGENNYPIAQKEIDKAISYDEQNLEILNEYVEILKIMSGLKTNDFSRNIQYSDGFVIAADKFNILYRGLVNPITIFLNGIPDSKIEVHTEGVTKAEGIGKYVADVTRVKGRTLDINVSGKMPNGKIINKKTLFRIKDLPKPVGTVRGESGIVKMNRNNIEIATFGVEFDDFDFELPLRLTGFKFQVTDQPLIDVKGDKLNLRAKTALSNVKKGSIIQIIDIEAKAQGVNVILKKVAPIIIEVID